MLAAGIDIVTDGEIRRESYSNRFANALEGLDLDAPGTALDRTGHPNSVPRVVGPVRRARPVQVRDTEFLRSLTDRPIRVTVPGPFTMSQQAQNDHYPDLRSLALAYAEAVNEELLDLVAAGADVVQIDEPYLQARPEHAREYALEAIERAFDGVTGATRALHTCFGYAAIVHEKPNGYPFLAELDSTPAEQISIEAAQPRLDPSILEQLPSKQVILGVLDLSDMTPETPQVVADRIRAALRHTDAERQIAPRGFAMPCPAMSGAEPWTGSNRPGASELGAMLAEAATPRPPWIAAARSVRTSPNRFEATTTSIDAGSRTMRAQSASTSTCSTRTSGKSAATSRTTSSQSVYP
jgi:5-methyltetrahydropteroyltriglutamate--homocysteine methyltransferase